MGKFNLLGKQDIEWVNGLTGTVDVENVVWDVQGHPIALIAKTGYIYPYSNIISTKEHING